MQISRMPIYIFDPLPRAAAQGGRHMRPIESAHDDDIFLTASRRALPLFAFWPRRHDARKRRRMRNDANIMPQRGAFSAR